MKLREHAILLVKLKGEGYDFAKFVEYRMNRGRDLKLVQNWLVGLRSFRYAVIFHYNKVNRSRGLQIGFIDRYKIDY